MAAVPHNYMLGAFTYGWFAGINAAERASSTAHTKLDEGQIERERQRVFAPLLRSQGLPPLQVEYKLRRFVNDYLQPPKVTRKYEIGLQRFDEIEEDIEHLHARDAHELMRAAEVSVIRDCAEMAARASLYRTESRWGLYHLRTDYPERNDAEWFCHTQLFKDAQGRMAHAKREIEPYIVPIDEQEKTAYDRLRIQREAPASTPQPITA